MSVREPLAELEQFEPGEIVCHKRDPAEILNVAEKRPELVARLMAKYDSGWQASLPESAN